MRYRRSVASAYSSVRPDQVATSFSAGPFHVSPKIDGELWFLVFDKGDVALVNAKGGILQGDMPFLKEAAAASKGSVGQTVIAGELFAATASGGDRPRVSGLASALGGGKEASIDRLGFMAFDPVVVPPGFADGGDLETAEGRSAALESFLGTGKHLKVVPYKIANSPAEISDLFSDWVEGAKAEGLVVRIPSGRVFKIKPEVTVDAVIVGFTERSQNAKQVRSVSLALRRESGEFQLIGACGNLGTDEQRQELHERLSPLETKANFRKASSDGSLYRFVRPEVIVEIKADDVQSVDALGKPIRHMTLEFTDDAWAGGALQAGASLIHPVMMRVRDDKSISLEELRFDQVTERCFIDPVGSTLAPGALPKSILLRREVYVKDTKGKKAVRKLLLWKTNKERNSREHPAYVVNLTDYSPDRKEPIRRTVRLAPSEGAANQEAEKLLEENIKKGWEKVG
jgi:ATP-dependent DNA ligase